MGQVNRRFKGVTYAACGVDRDAASSAVEYIKRKAQHTLRPEVLTGIGPFAGMFRLSGYNNPVLASSVDGVGTKVKIAISLDRHDTIGIDLVNHCVNDIFTCGAEPLFFLDYLAMGKIIPERVASIASGLSSACSDAGCALIGGETAEMPGLYAENDYDLAGFIIGIVEKDKIVDIGAIEAGDAILGLSSSGLHTNGYSLVRRIFDLDGSSAPLRRYYSELGHTLGEELLEPHRCYYPLLKPVLHFIKGMAHITGGGMPDNISRILREGLAVRIARSALDVLPIFELIQHQGRIDDSEMYRVFNMGIGMVVVCSSQDVDRVVAMIPEAKVIGEVAGKRGNELVTIS